MTSELEPPTKKLKIIGNINVNLTRTIDEFIERINSTEKNLKAVISDDVDQPLQLIKVFVGHIKNIKDISHTIQVLNEKIPLKELSHLKRVRRQDIILCPLRVLTTVSSIQEYIECHAMELSEVFDYFKEVEVPLMPPKLVKQYNETKKFWSCNFHPNNYLEKLVSDNFFNCYELKTHRKYMEVVFEVMKWYMNKNSVHYEIDNMFNKINTCVVVDPSVDRIVTVAFDNREVHPMQHSAMLVVDNVAKTQNGGVWSVKFSNDTIIPGIDKELIQHLKDRYPHLKIGLKHGKCKGDMQEDNSVKSGPYLCTGYYIYMLKEPCIMCSMALVHARAKRVFFCINNDKCGALSSVTKLQTVSSLNHHFEVFTGFL